MTPREGRLASWLNDQSSEELETALKSLQPGDLYSDIRVELERRKKALQPVG